MRFRRAQHGLPSSLNHIGTISGTMVTVVAVSLSSRNNTHTIPSLINEELNGNSLLLSDFETSYATVPPQHYILLMVIKVSLV